jgi:transposase-like protein
MTNGATYIGPSLSATRDMNRSARSVAGFVPDRVTTDGHNSYPRAIRSTLGHNVRHRTSIYLNNRLEQDHRGTSVTTNMRESIETAQPRVEIVVEVRCHAWPASKECVG